jgi:peptidoglycan/LPS O-acetylase OafA/YrhL/lysophospholipase L1-like esterase
MPGLDGVRALAVAAVIAYHLGLGWAPGGLLGVGVFFTLSGYLITDLLLGQWADGRRRLGEFWLRRARRLLPALFVMLAVVTVWVSVADRSQVPGLRGEVVSAVAYVNNWWQIGQHTSYFSRFSAPSPLSHLWSLAVEEQFYLLWPWLLLLGVRLIPERHRPVRVRPRLAGVTLVLAAASALEMAILYHPSFDSTRIYEGTDTRAMALLAGAALAMIWPSRDLTTRVTPGARRILDGLGVVGLVTIGLLVWRTDQYSAFLYRDGLVLLAIATVLVIAAGAHPATRVGRALGWGPLRWIGVRSYGIYLWHLPIIVLTTPAGSYGIDPVRAAAQVAATVAVAALSWRYVEEPIRHGALAAAWTRARAAGWRPALLSLRARVGLAAGVLAVVVVGLAFARALPPRPVSARQAAVRTQLGGVGASPAPRPHSLPVARERLRTSCRSVVHIGDSTSSGLISANYLPDRSQRMRAQYARVGVGQARFEITPATSIVETLPGGTDAAKVAERLRQEGYRGCWVIALGTNDTADRYVGSSVGLGTRIDRMIAAIGDQLVMWVNVKSLVTGGPYSEANMQRWNQALIAGCRRHPDMRVFDWASAARDSWFIPDGIHYYSPGYAARARLIADALAEAFPAGAASSSCVVRTAPISVPVLGIHHPS